MEKLTDEQRYYSLNGTFEAYHVIIELIRKGELRSFKELHYFLLKNMELVSKEMCDYEDTLKIN